MTTRTPLLLGMVAALLLGVLAPPAHAGLAPDWDTFNSTSISLTGSGEVGRTTFLEQDIVYDTSDYDLQPGFETQEFDRGGCDVGGGTFRRPAKTAWIRFMPGVAGTVSIEIDSTYDVYSAIFHTNNLSRGVVDYTPTKLIQGNCQDTSVGMGNELRYFEHVSTPNQAVLIMTAAKCAAAAAFDCDDPGETIGLGGTTSVHFRFVPDDADGDGVPDTLDGCDTVDGPASNNGCPLPDGDRDGVPDSSDQCPSVAGEAGSGCPPDADGDGIANSADACVFTAGIAPDGCPDPDPDRDGVAAASDKCPFELGRNADGCPDPDDDNVLNELDKCPLVKGLPGDGCPDTDGDGVSDRIDKCRTSFGRGADGCRTELDLRLPDRWRALGRTTTVVRLRALAAVGAKLEIRCVGRRACRLKPGARKRRTITIRRESTNLLSLFRSRRLRAGSAIEIRVTQRGYIGRFVRYDMRNGRIPKLTQKCLSSSGKAVAC